MKSRAALPAGLAAGDELTLKGNDEKLRKVTAIGAVYDPSGFPATFTGQATGYVTFDTLERLGGSRDYDQILLRVNGTPEQQLDQDYITGVANAVADKVEKAGLTVRRVQVPEPGKLALQDLFDALALLLTPLGLLALVLSGFLVINTISALMAQQVRQIGVMKAIGARRYQIVGMYLGRGADLQPGRAGHCRAADRRGGGRHRRLPGRFHQRRFPTLVAAAQRAAAPGCGRSPGAAAGGALIPFSRAPASPCGKPSWTTAPTPARCKTAG